MTNHIEIKNLQDCCGCAACQNACKLGAISMQEDAAGFIYPAVNGDLCAECGACVKVCAFTKAGEGANGEVAVYAAACKDGEILKKSSSGGMFSVLAKTVLDDGGAVFGAAWDDNFSLSHICVTDQNDLAKLRGSKYVQSNIGTAYTRAKVILDSGKKVCFCGTPCQISGLKSYLKKDYENLFTIDLVCHGVPSQKMLNDDLKNLLNDKYSAISNISFRDKQYGWGVKGSVELGGSKIKYNPSNSPYYFYFLKGEVYRESCYHCRFPKEGRQGDITLGDYWGIRGELLTKMGDTNPDLGVSCVLVNTKKGQAWFTSVSSALNYTKTTRAAVEKRNHQLTAPSTPLPEHQTLLGGYVKEGYAAYKNGYKKHLKDHVVRAVKNIIPPAIKRKINDIIH